MSALRYLAISFILMLSTGAAAIAFEPMSVTVRVSNGALYDYVILGEHPLATDGFDNAYDTIAPGNLNADMGEPYLSIVASQPGWKPALRELRGDIRSPAKKHQWQVAVSSSLAKGAPLAVELETDMCRIPSRMKLLVRDGKKDIDLRVGSYSLPAPGPGAAAVLFMISEQP